MSIGLRLIIASLCMFLAVPVPRVRAQSMVANDAVLCGPQSLLVICQSLKVEADLDELQNLSAFDEKAGTTMLGLKKAAEAKGLHAVGMKISLEELVTLETPAIAHQWDNHFVVVEGGESGAIKVTDPPAEPKVVPLEEFKQTYSGFALLVAKDESLFPKPKANGPDLRFDSYTYDFGFIEQGEQTSHTFTYENKGNEELVLSKAETSCTCALAFLSEERRIPPGGKGELVVGFDSAGRQGGQSHTVYVHSNDPISPFVHRKAVEADPCTPEKSAPIRKRFQLWVGI